MRLILNCDTGTPSVEMLTRLQWYPLSLISLQVQSSCVCSQGCLWQVPTLHPGHVNSFIKLFLNLGEFF